MGKAPQKRPSADILLSEKTMLQDHRDSKDLFLNHIGIREQEDRRTPVVLQHFYICILCGKELVGYTIYNNQLLGG